MKICDLTQFHSPTSGGVKRYVSEKVRYLRDSTAAGSHVLIIPGDRDALIQEERSRTYLIKSPLVSRQSRYRVLLRLGAVEEILGRERPDLIESGDPYQLAWKAVQSGGALGIPVIGFYHSHFPEAYVRTVRRFVGDSVTDCFMDFARRYIRNLYNRFARTLVPSPALGDVLTAWGVKNVALTDLGVDAAVFQPQPQPGEDVRAELGIPRGCTLLLYVGRLAQEKNTATLFAACRLLGTAHPGRFHLLVIGDGLQRRALAQLQAATRSVTWLPYCAVTERLAQLYRAADLFVHPGMQETFGLVALEAQSCGTPVIGIRGSYMDRIIHTDQTIWTDENSAAALARAIAAQADRELPDRRLLHERIASQYSWDQVFTGLVAIYREVVAGGARGSFDQQIIPRAPTSPCDEIG